MGRRGITLVELLVVTVIVFLVLGAVYVTYINLLKGFKKGSEGIASEIESLVGLELLRLDIEHAGYGVPEDETSLVVDWNSTDKILTLRSTLNNTNESTRGYLVAKCETSSLNVNVDSREDTSNGYLSVLYARDKKFFAKGTESGSTVTTTETCDDGEIYIAFPVREEVYNGTSNGCSVGYCEEVTYRLSNSNLIDRCNKNAYNLVRKVGTGTDVGGEPILNCVADWEVRFDVDINENGVLESGEFNRTSLPSTNEKIRNQLKRVNVYILIQQGNKDPNYTFTQVVDCGSNKCVNADADGIKLKLPEDYVNYRWKVIKLSAKPMDL